MATRKKRTKLKPGRWWDDETQGELHHRIYDTCTWLKSNDGPRRARFLYDAQLYANRELAGLDAAEYYRAGADREEDPRLNVCRNQVDSVQAKIAKNKPRATFLTEAGDFSLQQKARRLEQFVAGVSYKQKLYQLAQNGFRDSAVFGSGVIKAFGRKVSDKLGEVCIERTYPWELHIDPLEAVYGNPRSLFHTRLVDRGVLLALFAGDEDAQNAIRDASSAQLDGEVSGDRLADQILVVEAWHLPSGPDAGDGRHAIVIEDATLTPTDEQEWNEPRFPFQFLFWSRPLMGFWGTSLVSEIEGLQKEMNELMRKIQLAFYYNAVPTIIAPPKFDKKQLDNDMRGRVVTATNPEAIQFHAPQTINPEVPAHLQRLYQWSYEIAGVSQLSAQSKKPAGLNSGVALAEYNDIESERFMIRGQDYEEFFVGCAELIVMAARQLDAAGLDVEVKAEDRVRRRSFLRKIKWKEVALEHDAFQLKIFPASSLPQSPAGRKAAVESLFMSQMIDKQTAMQLLDFPDLDATLSRELAPYDLVLDQIEIILDEGGYVAPEPFQDLALAIKIGNQTYLRAKIDRVPEERLQKLRDFIDECDRLLKLAEAEAAAKNAPPAPPVIAAPNGAAVMPPGGAPVPPQVIV